MGNCSYIECECDANIKERRLEFTNQSTITNNKEVKNEETENENKEVKNEEKEHTEKNNTEQKEAQKQNNDVNQDDDIEDIQDILNEIERSDSITFIQQKEVVNDYFTKL
jgi:hypothetical protein